jgi:hypothetical protein
VSSGGGELVVTVTDERAGDEVPPADADVFEHHQSAASGELDLDVRGGVGDQDSTTEAIADGSHPTVPRTKA